MTLLLAIVAAIPFGVGLIASLFVRRAVHAAGIPESQVWIRWGICMAISFCWSVLGYALWPAWYADNSPMADVEIMLRWGVPWLVCCAPSYVTCVGVIFFTPVRRPITLRSALVLLAICSVAFSSVRVIMLLGRNGRAKLEAREQVRLKRDHDKATSIHHFASYEKKLTYATRQRLFNGEFTTIELAGTDISDEDIDGINLKSVVSLYLSRTQISDKCLATIATAPMLEILDISDTRVSERGLRALSQSNRLRSVTIAGMQFGDSTVDVLELIPNLTEIICGGTAISRVRLSEFRKRQRMRVAP